MRDPDWRRRLPEPARPFGRLRGRWTDCRIEDLGPRRGARGRQLQPDCAGAVARGAVATFPLRTRDSGAGVERTGRTPGTVTAYEWDGVLPSDDLIQHAITEAVTGIISLDNTLVIAGYFRALPAAVTIVEVEPAEHAFGFELSPPVERAVASVSTLIRETVA